MKKTLALLLFIIALDIQGQPSYYDDVDLTKTGIDLKDELAKKIISSHTKYLDYGWNVDKETDKNPADNTKVFLIYGWEDGTDSDCTNDKLRDIDKNGGNQCDWNREHVYAKSLGTPAFKSKSIQGSDGHHIRASDVKRNSLRGNKRFADGLGTSKVVSGNWYPGDEWKGDVARIIMYMYLRYGNQCLPKNIGVGTTNATDKNMIDLFLKWNAEDKVSDVEIQRNNYLSDVNNLYGQGNRNPFIDNPYLATKIWGGPIAEKKWVTSANNTVFKNYEISVYPNPTKNKTIIVNVFDGISVDNIIVYSLLGEEIYHKKKPIITNNKITIYPLKSGVYFLKISNGSSNIIKKVIVR